MKYIFCLTHPHTIPYNDKKAKKVIRDPSHPSHALFALLQSLRHRQYRSIMGKLKDWPMVSTFRPSGC
jgi:hypothetical protein